MSSDRKMRWADDEDEDEYEVCWTLSGSSCEADLLRSDPCRPKWNQAAHPCFEES